MVEFRFSGKVLDTKIAGEGFWLCFMGENRMVDIFIKIPNELMNKWETTMNIWVTLTSTLKILRLFS